MVDFVSSWSLCHRRMTVPNISPLLSKSAQVTPYHVHVRTAWLMALRPTCRRTPFYVTFRVISMGRPPRMGLRDRGAAHAAHAAHAAQLPPRVFLGAPDPVTVSSSFSLCIAWTFSVVPSWAPS